MIPSKVKVAGIEYQVKEVEGNLEKFNNLGQINYFKGIIEIDDSMAADRKEQTFVHELLHACFKEAGFDEQDEDMIDRVSAILYQVMKDNQLHFGKTIIETDSGMKMTMNY
ncbi:ImmA/IrrE family metallo-endopeptidase [Cytobacillus sp. FSL W8-0315]|uniref:ImmA/IrrE family metallo-endopeptidase n=1 Tax=Cytobacillus sp. FSL W8-0315 TaxID=2921600 RepID=UPI0030F62E61